MLKRRYRLTDKERFRQVRQTGRSYAHPLVVLCLLPTAAPTNRCGFTASRRIGNAVSRNRARRRLSEALRLVWDLVEPGCDMVWIARPGIGEAAFSDLQAACVRLLRRAGALQAPQSMVPGEPPAVSAAPTSEPSAQNGRRETERCAPEGEGA